MNVNTILNSGQFRNVSNINVSVPTGPNGPNGNVYEVNINVSDNRLRPNVGGPNVQGFTSSVIPKQSTNRQVVNRPKPTVANNKAKPKPSPGVASAATRRPQPRPNTVSAPQTRRRTVRPASQAVTTPVIAAPAVQIQEPQPVIINVPVIQAENNIPVMQQTMSNDMAVQAAVTAPAVNAVGTPAMRRTVSSAGSGSSAGTRRSKSKRHGSFSYQAAKKLKKLFAHNRKGKFDPAKCFVWN